MKIFYAQDPYDRDAHVASVFLAGPTPRSKDVPSWRPEAVELYKKHEFDGHLYIPERDDWEALEGYGNQIEWEHYHLDICCAILMWVPRELKLMPSLTTNVEFGLYLRSKWKVRSRSGYRLFYGRPDDAPKNGYLNYCYRKFTQREPCNTLEGLVEETMEYMKRLSDI